MSTEKPVGLASNVALVDKGSVLIRKVAEIMAEVGRVPKTGHNDHFNYDYATEADVAEVVRTAMSKRNLALLPHVEKCEFVALGKMRLCTLIVDFTLEDGDSGETRVLRIVGEGSDMGDKASYKAFTGAEKYALMKLFLIPTGDDPERDHPGEAALTAEPPPPSDADAPPLGPGEDPPPPSIVGQMIAEKKEAAKKGAAKGPVPTVPFDLKFGGATAKKGTPLTKVTDKDLAVLFKYAEKAVGDPTKSKYKEGNTALLAAVNKEIEARQIPF